MNIEIDFSKLKDVTNDKYFPLYQDKNRYLLLMGGRGSGKSNFAAEKIIFRIGLSLIRGYKEVFIVCRKTQPSLRKSAFTLLKKYINQWGMSKLVKINKASMSFEFVNGSQILCTGLDDPEKLKSIEGVTSVWLEEPPELSETDFLEVDLVLRGITPSYKQIIMSFNPHLCWIKDRFFDCERLNTTICHTTYKDNRFLDREEYEKILEEIEDQDLYDIYTLGKWAQLTGLVYKNWEVYEISTYDKDYNFVLLGLDFGFNHPMAFIKIGVKDDDLYIFDEFYECGITIPELIPKIKYKVLRGQYITADCAYPASIKEIADAGINIKPSIKGPGSVKDGIEWVRRRKIYIHPLCINTIKEIGSYKYKVDKKTGKLSEDPVKFMDDLMDAMRYAVEEIVTRFEFDYGTTGVEREYNHILTNWV